MRKISIAAIMEKKKAATTPLTPSSQTVRKKKDFQTKPYSNVMKEKTETVEERSFLRKVESQRKGSFAVVMLAVSNMGIRANGQHWHQGNCSLKAEKSEMKAWPCRSLNYVHFMLRLQPRADRCILLS